MTILIILMAVAIPAIFTIRKNLRQKALDNKAEIIYTAVQNNLTKLRSNGNSEKYAEDKASPLDATPLDMDEKKTLYYVTADSKNSDTSAASVLVTEDTIDADLYQHYWVVEYDPASASVYAVFYSETRSGYTTASYNNLRYKDNRLRDGAQVGYYGGDSVDSGNTSTLAPKITVQNEEKLQVTITSKRPDQNPLSYVVTLQDTLGHTLTLRYQPDMTGTKFGHGKDDLSLAETSQLYDNESGTIRGSVYTLTLTLDDLTQETTRFAALYGSKNSNLIDASKQLVPGTDLTIKVTVKSKSSLVDGLSTEVKTNSLFGDDSTADQAAIYYGRHLQNLDQNSGVTETITGAVQKSDIHFEEQTDLDSDNDLASWYSCYQDKAFHPITNTKLLSYKKAEAVSEDSGSTQPALISHLTTEKSEKAGLFAETAANMTISDIRLSGAKINGKSGTGTYAGAVAAYADGKLTLSNCQVYLDSTDVAGKDASESWIQGADIQGGLIGSAAGKVTITNCLAATVMGSEETSLAGGLVGEAQKGSAIQQSYADSYITGQVTGGLIGRNTSGSLQITSCYTAGYQKAVKKAAGFLAERNNGTATVDYSYAAVTWLKAGDVTDTVRYSTIPNGQYDELINLFFLNGGTDYSDGTETDGTKKSWAGEKVSYTDLSNRQQMVVRLNSNAFVSAAVATNPYNLKQQGLTSYSYPALSGMPHYGDWEADFESGSLVYYEVYQETSETGTIESYGFHGGNVTPTLRDDVPVIGDGYGIVYEQASLPDNDFTVLYQKAGENGDITEEKLTIAKQEATPYKVVTDDKTYYIYPLPAEIVNAAAVTDTWYQKITVQGASAVGRAATDETDDKATGSVFYYNPHFAKTEVNAAEAPETPTEVSVRTPRQLYALSQNYTAYAKITAKSTFNQELDLDYQTYDWQRFAGEDDTVSVQIPIGEATPFVAKYDGKYHKIQGISFESKQTRVGFIAENQGTIRDLFLVSDYQVNGTNPHLKYNGQIGNNQTVYMGTLAAVNSGQILNCAVSGFYLGGDSCTVFVRQNGTLYFGGLTGTNQGTIRNSQVDTPLVNANILYGNAYIAGFAGENAGTIRNSYAIGKATVEYAKGAKAVLSGFTAKNLGQLTGDYCAVAMTAAGSTSTYGFAPKGGSINRNCRYLSGGTFRYLGNLEAYDNTSGAGQAATYEDLKQKKATAAECSSATGSGEGYPFTAVVTTADRNKVHFGNWQLASDLGSFGIIYWENEQNGSNNGYHFSYIGYTEDAASPEDTVNRVSGSTLCQEHDDGGVITEYGYGYYYSDTLTGTNVPEVSGAGFRTGDRNAAVSEALEARLKGFKVTAYTTQSSVGENETAAGSYMRMEDNSNNANAVWYITDNRSGRDNRQYVFTFNPFFGDAMQYGMTGSGEELATQVTVQAEDGSTATGTGHLAMPGTAENQYEIRSADQLQYMNWNSREKNATTSLSSSNYRVDVNSYTYLGQMTQKYYEWTASEIPFPQKYDYRQYRENQEYRDTQVTAASEYWDFIVDENGRDYYLPYWTLKGSDYKYNWCTKKGYWKWVGSGTPKVWNNNVDRNDCYKEFGTEYNNTLGKYCWIQTHDVNAYQKDSEGRLVKFTQIGSLYDTKAAVDAAEADVYIAYFAGDYNGNTYCIKNVEIDSKNSVVGLFGAIIGAEMKNVTLYSDQNNTIQRSADSPRSWYAIGGLCGLAGVGKGNTVSTIRNCTVSGYTIRDNSRYSSWGDGNVGGMFGISTMNLQQCSAVNTIELNTVIKKDNNKKDGVSVRTGGLVGSMRGELTRCYTGGEITCTKECLDTARSTSDNDDSEHSNGAKIFLGGLTGGIYLKDGGNLGVLLGDNIKGFSNYKKNQCGNRCGTTTTLIQNCYTYIRMPNGKDTDRIFSIEPLGSNGETPFENDNNRHVRVLISNSYYYEDGIGEPQHFTIGNNGGEVNIYYGEEGNKVNNLSKDPKTQAISWDQLAGRKPVAGNRDLASVLGFGKVTTVENGNGVKGKYTFPGNRKDLEGENYPFPTILQQNTSGGVVNVHYGEWPLNGMYWEESRADMDIFEDLVTDGGEDDGKALKNFVLKDAAGNVGNDKTFKDFSFIYRYEEDETSQITSGTAGTEADGAATEEAAGSTGTGSNILDDEDLIAKVVNIKYDSEVKGYVATVQALKTGTEIITATVTGKKDQEYSASFTLTVTADLTVYASSSTVTQYVGENTELSVYAVPMSMYSFSTDGTVTADLQSADGEDAVVEDQTLGADESESTLEEITEAVSESEEDPESGVTVDTEGISDNTILPEGASQDDTDSAETVPETGDSTMDQASEIAVQMADDWEEETEELLVTPYADTAGAAPEKNLADRMTWKVENDAQDEGYVDYTQIQNGVFTITSQAESQVTLTIIGTYEYEGISYTATTWVDVITQSNTDNGQSDAEQNLSTMTDLSGDDDTVIMEDDEDFEEILIQDEDEYSGSEEDLSDNGDGSTDNTDGSVQEETSGGAAAQEEASDAGSADVVTENTAQDQEAAVGLESLNATAETASE